jgi:hypothetical protein
LPNTFAALPVGASKIIGTFSSLQVFTSALTSVVLPVPAYPLSKKVLCDSLLFINEEKRSINVVWSLVGSNLKCFNMQCLNNIGKIFGLQIYYIFFVIFGIIKIIITFAIA